MSEGRAGRGVYGPDGAGHAPNVPAGYKRTEMGVIPEEWNTCTIGDLFAFKNGLNKAKRFFGTGIPIVNYMDVFERSGLTADSLAGRVTLTPDEIRNYQVRIGDVFFTRTSETVEEIGVASAMLDDPCDTVFSGFVLRARPRDGQLNDTYKQYCFAVRSVRSQIVSNATYTTRALTNGRSLSGVHIAVPPRPEQRAIAAVLSDVDELIGSLETLIAKKRAIKQATMQQLLTGRTRLPGFGGEWEVVELNAFVRIRDRKISPVEVRGDTPCVELEHIGQGDGRLTSHGRAERTSSIKHRFEPRDVLFGRLRPYLRKWWYADRAGVCSTEIWPLVVDQGRAESGFVYALVQTGRFLDAAEASYGTHMPRADWNIVSGVEFPLPPLPEQQAIATVLSDMDAEIVALEHRLDKTRAIKQGMMQQLLTGSIRLPIPEDHTGDDAHDA